MLDRLEVETPICPKSSELAMLGLKIVSREKPVERISGLHAPSSNKTRPTARLGSENEEGRPHETLNAW